MSSAFGADPAPTEESVPGGSQGEAPLPVPGGTVASDNGQAKPVRGRHIRRDVPVGKHARVDESQVEPAPVARAKHTLGRRRSLPP